MTKTWNIHSGILENSDKMKHYLESIGEDLKRETDNKLGYDIKYINMLSDGMIISYEFYLNYKVKDFSRKYLILRIDLKTDYIKVYTDYIENDDTKEFERFEEATSYIGDSIRSDAMGGVITYILKFIKLNSGE